MTIEVKRIDDSYGFRLSIAETGSGGVGGGKGGKGSSAGVNEQANTIRSKAYVKLLFALSEGQILGFGSAPTNQDVLTNIFLDETPIMNSDGSYNFKDVYVEYRYGTQDQPYIPGVASSVEREVNVGTQLKQVNGALTRTITDPNLDAVRLRFMFPAMRTISNDGKTIGGATVEFSIRLQPNGGSLTEVIHPIVTEKSTSPFEIANFHVPLTGNPPWNLSVLRITPDSTTDKVQNDLYWQGYTEIIDAKLKYPNTALLFVQVDAEQFSSIPKLSVRGYGIVCQIPHNYNATTRAYSGLFNGSLVPGWTNNPVWILYDLITNNRYGLGERINPTQIDVTTFYSAAQYCDELVPDGFGGLEPRFVFNAYITTEDDALKLLEAVCAVFRSMPYSYGGTIQLSQDRPRKVTKIFSPANVICEDEEGNATPPFTYSDTDSEVRYTAARVTYANTNDFYRDAQEYYQSEDGIARYGFNLIEAKGFGITSRGQAYRYAKWLVEFAQYCTNTVTFRVGSEGELVNVGEVFEVANPLKMIQRFYGRTIGGSTSTVIQMDQPITLDTTKAHTITLWNPNTNLSEERSIVFPQPTSSSVTVSTAFGFVPSADTVFQLKSAVNLPKPFQCVSVVESGNQFEITGIDYFNGLYDLVDKDTLFDVPNYSGFANLRDPVAPPSALTVVDSLYQSIGSGGIKVRADIGWTPSTSPWVTKYLLEYKRTSDTQYTKVTLENSATSYTIEDIQPATYQFKVTAVNGLGAQSSPLYSEVSILGLANVPADVTNLQINYYSNYSLLTWDPSPDLDVKFGGSFQIKYTSKTAGVTWFDGTEIARVPGSTNSVQVPILNGTFLIKAVDSSDNVSRNPAIIINSNLPQTTSYLADITVNESPAFPGTKDGVTVFSNSLKLKTDDQFTAQSGNFTSKTGNFTSAGGTGLVLNNGFYYFQNPVDLGDVYTVRITANFSAYAVYENQFFTKTPGKFTERLGLFTGDSLTQASAVLQIATSQDGIAYTAWQDFVIGDYLGRAFKFRVKLNSETSNQNVYIPTLGVYVDVPERVESGNATTNSGLASTVNFGSAFKYTPKVALTILNAQSGDSISSVTPSNSGFNIEVRDAANNIVSRNISFFAQGFGKKAI